MFLFTMCTSLCLVPPLVRSLPKKNALEQRRTGIQNPNSNIRPANVGFIEEVLYTAAFEHDADAKWHTPTSIIEPAKSLLMFLVESN